MANPILLDLRNYVYLIWKHIGLPDPTPTQYEICSYLQHGPKRCVIEAFRGVGKSWLTSAFATWLLLRDPQLKIMVVSASKERADAFSTFTKRLIYEVPMLQHLRPNPSNGQRDRNDAFDVGPAKADHSPSIRSVGIQGQMTGSRADIIIADDVETPKNSLTQLQRDRLAVLVSEFEAILKPLDTSRIIYLGTPQTEMSLYSRLPERGYEVRIWPARLPLPDKADYYEGKLAPAVQARIEAGERPWTPVDPDRFNDMDLLEREASYGRSGFALQFMLDTSLSDGDRYPLKLSDLIVMDVSPDMAPAKLAWGGSHELAYNDLPNVGLSGDRLHKPLFVSPEWAEYTGSVMAIDPSGRGGDDVGYAVVKMCLGKLYVTAAGGVQGGYDDATLETLAKIARDQKVNYVVVESNFGDGMFTKLFSPVLFKFHKCGIEEVRHSSQKELRIIDTLEPVMNQHRLIVDRKLVEKDASSGRHPNYQLFHQMTRITKERHSLAHDDALDALSMAVGYWVEQMARDADAAYQEHQDELIDQELRKFMETALGRPQKAANWCSR